MGGWNQAFQKIVQKHRDTGGASAIGVGPQTHEIGAHQLSWLDQ